MKLRGLLVLLVVLAALIAFPILREKGGALPRAPESAPALTPTDEIFDARWLTEAGAPMQVEVRRRSAETARTWLARAALQLAEELAVQPPVDGWIEPWDDEAEEHTDATLAIAWNVGEFVQCRVRLRKPAALSAEPWALEALTVESAILWCFPEARRSES